MARNVMPSAAKPTIRFYRHGGIDVRPQALTDLDDIFDYIAEDRLDRAIALQISAMELA